MRVAELWRFPVKSMGGERLDGADVDERGIAGDRQWALLDVATGKTLTGRREPKLLFASARLSDDGGVDITTEAGDVLAGDGALSAWLGRDVRLVRPGDVEAVYETPVDFEHERTGEWVAWEGPEATFHDSKRTQVSILSHATIDGWDVRRFRANVVLDAGDEFDLVGSTVQLGTVVADVVKRIDRCVMVTRPQAGGVERDLDVLRTIHKRWGGDRAVGALVTSPGTVAVGDPLEVSPG